MYIHHNETYIAKTQHTALLLILVMSMLNIVPFDVFGQCTNTTSYGSATAPVAGASVTMDPSCQYAGEYSTLNSVPANTDYIVSSTVTNDWITIRQGAFNGTLIAFGQTPLSWTSTVAGTYFIHVNTNNLCNTESACRDLTVQWTCTATPNTSFNYNGSWAIASRPCYITGNYDGTGTQICGGDDAIRMRATNSFMQMQFNFVPQNVEFCLGVNTDLNNTVKLEQSANGSTWTTVANPVQNPPIISTTVTRDYALLPTTRYLRWTQINYTGTGNNRIDNVTVTEYNPCASITTITGCGVSYTAALDAPSTMNPTLCGFASSGQERIYSFTPTVTGNHTINVSAASGGFVNYAFKAASGGCNSSGWTCIGFKNSVGDVGTVSLTAGVEYYILVVGQSTGARSQTFSITNCPVACTNSTIALTSGTQNPTVCAGFAIPTTVYTFGGSATNAVVTNLPAGLSSSVNTSIKTVTISGTPTAGGTYTITTSGHTSPCTAASISGTVTRNTTSAVGAVSANQIICSGTQPANMTIASANGTVQWQRADDAGFTTNVTAVGTNSNTLTGAQVGALTATRYFRARVTSGVCPAVFSNIITVMVDAATVAGSVSGGSEICAGESSGVLTLSGYTGSIIRWESSVDNGGSWQTISHTSPSYTAPAVAQSTRFRAVVQSGVCTAANSDFTTVNAITCICPGATNGSVTFNAGAGTGSDSYEVSINNGGNWIAYTPGALINTTGATGYVKVRATRTGCGTDVNEYTIWKVLTPPNATIANNDGPVCIGQTLTLTANPVAGATYLWTGPNGFSSPDQNPVVNNFSANSVGDYSVTINIGGCNSPDATTTVSINQPNTTISGINILNNDYLWNGNTNTNWSNAANWYKRTSQGYELASVEPTTSTNVFIFNTTDAGNCVSNTTPIVNSNPNNAHNVYIGSGAVLGMNNNMLLDVYRNFTNLGSLVLDGTTDALTNTRTIRFRGAAIQLLNSGGTNNSAGNRKNFGRLQIEKTDGYVQIETHDVQVRGNIDILSGELRAGDRNITLVDGNWTNSNGVFNAGTGTVTMNISGTNTRTITSGGIGTGKQFNKLTKVGTGTLKFSGDCFVQNDIDVSAGTLDTEAYKVYGKKVNNIGNINIGSGGQMRVNE